MNGLYAAVTQRGNKALDRLIMILTADELRMSDAERMQAIDQVHADVSGQLEDLRRFNEGVTIQALQRAREHNNVNTLKTIYDHP